MIRRLWNASIIVNSLRKGETLMLKIVKERRTE
jgi:hypothetical protein